MAHRPLFALVVSTFLCSSLPACSSESPTTASASASSAKPVASTRSSALASTPSTPTAPKEGAPATSGSAPSATPSSSAAPAAGEAKRTVGAFTELRIGTSLEAYVEVGPAGQLELTGDPDVVAAVETRLEGSALIIALPTGDWKMKTPLKVRVPVPSLTKIQASTASVVDVKGLACEKLEVDAATSAKVTLAGKCKQLGAKAATSGSIDASKLETESATVSAETGANVSLNASLSVTGTAATGAKVHVAGNPKEKKVETATGATVD